MQLDRLTRKIMRQHKAHHYCTSVERLYIKCISGGRGLVNIRQAYKREVVALGLYLVNAVQVELLQAVVKHKLFLTRKAGTTTCRRLSRSWNSTPTVPTWWRGEAIREVREGMLQLKAAQACELARSLTAKPIHRVYYLQASESEGVDTEGTFAWLRDGRLWVETEALVIAVQDGVLLTNQYKHTVLV